jgi:hypothetical protein
MSKHSYTAEELELKYHLVNKYRDLISRRYEGVIKNIDQTGIDLRPEVAHQIKEFFLHHVYPEPHRRKKLDAAFLELRNFTTHPALVWGLLGSLPVAIMQFGVQFPAAIQAGITSLKAYTSAIAFEEAILHKALQKDLKEPVSDEEFFDCLKSIPHKSLDTFINEATVLFMVISDTTLLSKTMKIMQDVIRRMEKRSDLYTKDQVDAIRIGLDLMEHGYQLLEPFDSNTKKAIIEFIAESEREFLAEIHGVKENKHKETKHKI